MDELNNNERAGLELAAELLVALLPDEQVCALLERLSEVEPDPRYSARQSLAAVALADKLDEHRYAELAERFVVIEDGYMMVRDRDGDGCDCEEWTGLAASRTVLSRWEREYQISMPQALQAAADYAAACCS